MRQTIAVLGSVPAVVISENITDVEACVIEIALIRAIGRGEKGPLVNMTDGGEGMVGWVQSKETVDKRRVTLANPAVKLSQVVGIRNAYINNPELRERQRQSHKTPQFIENMKRQRSDPGYKIRQSEAIKAVVRTPEVFAKKSVASKRTHADPLFKIRHKAAVRAALAAISTEQKERQADNMRAAWVIRKQRMLDKHSAS